MSEQNGKVHVKVNLTRRYGDLTVELGAVTDRAIPVTDGNYQKAVAVLTAVIDATFADMESNYIPGHPFAQQAGHREAVSTTRDFDVTKVIVSHDGKQTKMRIFGGSYHKWGVPVYEEVIEAHTILSELGLGEHTPEGWKATAQLENGKAKRVVSVRDE